MEPDFPQTDVPIYLSKELMREKSISARFQEERAPEPVRRRALATYEAARRNAVALLEEAQVLYGAGHFAKE